MIQTFHEKADLYCQWAIDYGASSVPRRPGRRYHRFLAVIFVSSRRHHSEFCGEYSHHLSDYAAERPGIYLRSLDTNKEEHFASFDALRNTRRFRLPLAARLLQFFAPKEGLLIETDSESPAGAGISGSSALMIATTAALARFTDRNLTLEQMRVIAQNVEAQIINVPTGCQDYYPALYGGVSAIHLDADGIHREAVPITPEEIESRFVLAYTGAPRQSGINNWEVFQAHINGDKRVFRNFERIAEIARAMHNSLAHGDWDGVARLLREEWKLRRTNAPRITTPLIDKLISLAAKTAAWPQKLAAPAAEVV